MPICFFQTSIASTIDFQKTFLTSKMRIKETDNPICEINEKENNIINGYNPYSVEMTTQSESDTHICESYQYSIASLPGSATSYSTTPIL